MFTKKKNGFRIYSFFMYIDIKLLNNFGKCLSVGRSVPIPFGVWTTAQTPKLPGRCFTYHNYSCVTFRITKLSSLRERTNPAVTLKTSSGSWPFTRLAYDTQGSTNVWIRMEKFWQLSIWPFWLTHYLMRRRWKLISLRRKEMQWCWSVPLTELRNRLWVKWLPWICIEIMTNSSVENRTK